MLRPLLIPKGVGQMGDMESTLTKGQDPDHYARELKQRRCYAFELDSGLKLLKLDIRFISRLNEAAQIR
jgi:hypothetical protein